MKFDLYNHGDVQDRINQNKQHNKTKPLNMEEIILITHQWSLSERLKNKLDFLSTHTCPLSVFLDRLQKDNKKSWADRFVTTCHELQHNAAKKDKIVPLLIIYSETSYDHLCELEEEKGNNQLISFSVRRRNKDNLHICLVRRTKIIYNKFPETKTLLTIKNYDQNEETKTETDGE